MNHFDFHSHSSADHHSSVDHSHHGAFNHYDGIYDITNNGDNRIVDGGRSHSSSNPVNGWLLIGIAAAVLGLLYFLSFYS